MFKLHIPGRVEVEAPTAANAANPLIGHLPVAANDAAPVTISGLAGLADSEARDADHAAVTQFSTRTPGKPRDRPYRLTQAQGDAAHAQAWDDASIARFQARLLRLLRLGIASDDADDLAERLHLRDVEADDRRSCAECLHARPAWRCAKGDVFLLAQLQRCPQFIMEKTL